MTEHRIENEIHIQRAPGDVFAYVSSPWRWHEWHPASESATRCASALSAGATFEEMVSMATVNLIPLRIRRQMRWTVISAQAPHSLELRGVSKIIEVRLKYELKVCNGTHFRRTFDYRVKGWLRHIERWLVLPKMQRQSVVALAQLKHNLEAQGDPA